MLRRAWVRTGRARAHGALRFCCSADLSLGHRLAEGGAFFHDELAVMEDVFDVILDHGAEGDFSSFGVNPRAGEGVVGQGAEQFAHEASVHREEFAGLGDVALVVAEERGEARLVVTDEQGIVHRDDAAHAVARDEIAIERVEDALLHAPGAGDGVGVELIAGEAHRPVLEFIRLRDKCIQMCAVHDESVPARESWREGE